LNFSMGDNSPGRSWGVDTVDNVFDGLIDAAGGKALPGRWGLAQALLSLWSGKRESHPSIYWPKIALNTAGIVRAYRRAKNPEKNVVRRKHPVIEWIDAKGVAVPEAVIRIAPMILAYSAHAKHEDITIGDLKDEWVRTFQLDNVDYHYIMWKSSDGQEVGDGPYVAKVRHPDFVNRIGEFIWAREGYNDLQLTSTRNTFNRTFQLSNIGHPDDYVDADDAIWKSVGMLADRCRAFQVHGRSRNILFYGPPGTGKTTLARSVARAIGDGHTLRIEAEALDSIGVSGVLAFVGLLRPRVLLFDDLDRCMSAVIELMHCMELTSRDASLIVIGTINAVEEVDPALLRPGRFDEVIEISEPDDKHTARIIDHYATKLNVTVDRATMLEAMRGFSPADIREVLQCAATIGVAHIGAELERVQRQRGLYSGGAIAAYNQRKRLTLPMSAAVRKN
jgi:hypothetical protein